MPAIAISRRLILPTLGIVVFLFAYLAQNVWQIFHINDITRVIQHLDSTSIVASMAILGFVEATIVLCFYVPGTAVVIMLLLGMRPGWAEAFPLMAGLMIGTMVGYAASLALGRLLQQRLPSLVGEVYFHEVQSLIERYGSLAFVAGAFHPNQLALGFAILGYFQAARVWRYFIVAGVAQLLWWGIFASAADLIAGQNLVSSSNFQLYVAGLFSIWLMYELWARHPQKVQ